MKINKMVLYNFGVYAGENTFDFNSDKPVVLIGGMNGHGKTTFLEAILLALYGSSSPSYKEKKNVSYVSYLKSYINRTDGTLVSKIYLKFELNKDDCYEITREWKGFGRSVDEVIFVSHNGKYDSFLTKNWPMFVENILPNALSNFFFFDGEKITEMTLDKEDNQVKDSVKAMLGITVLDTLDDDLMKILRRIERQDKGKKEEKIISKKREEIEKIGVKLDSYIGDLENKKRLVEKSEARVQELRNQYSIRGGDAINKRQELIQKESELKAKIKQIDADLIEIAASELPFLMVKDLVSEIKLQSIDEQNDRVMRQSIAFLNQRLSDFSSTSQEPVESINKFLDYVKADLSDDPESVIYDLSDHAIYQLNELTEHTMKDNKTEAINKITEKQTYLNELDKISSYLSININEKELKDVLDKISEEETKCLDLKNELRTLENYVEESEREKRKAESDLNHLVESYLSDVEVRDEKERETKYLNMASRLINVYRVKLQKQKTEVLAQTITKCYLSLVNKKNLINKIEMNPETLDLIYLTNDGISVSKDSLSAGEKQLVVISTLWALAICSQKKLPVIIDTPLARLDSKHRESLVKTYFPNASEQTIILSTDSEIDQTFYDIIKENVGDEFTLVYDEKTRSTSIRKGYFKEEFDAY